MVRVWKKSLLVQMAGSFSLLSLALVATVMGATFLQARASIKQSVFDRLTAAAALKESELTRWFLAHRHTIVGVSRLSTVNRAAQILLTQAPGTPAYDQAFVELQTLLKEFIRDQHTYREIVLSSKGGRIVLSTNPDNVGVYAQPIYGSDVTLEPVAGEFVANVYADPVTAQPTVTFTIPIVDDQGAPLGLLSTHLNLYQVDAIVRDSRGLGQTGESYLVADLGTPFASQPMFVSSQTFSTDAEGMSFDQEVNSPGIAAAISGNDGQGLYGNYTGVPVIGVYQWLEGFNVALVVEMNQAEAFIPARRLAEAIGLLGGGLALVLTLSTLWVARRIVNPIVDIAHTAEAIADQLKGGQVADLPLVAVGAASNHELGLLARTFNRMATQLRQSLQALAIANQELEHRVQVRTAELQAATWEAEAANRTKSQFLAAMSHELRTPLNGILGYTQILRRSPRLSADESTGVSIIHQCGTHLLTLINDILDVCKIEAHKLELLPLPLHLPNLLVSVVQGFKLRADQKHLAFHYQPQEPLPTAVMADEARLRQVLDNLLSNAIKFTDQGSVTLRAAALSLTGPQSHLQVEVVDTGVGIAPADQARLFQAFEQVGDRRRYREGTGLGLALSQQIVQLMGGTLEVQSTPGQGSTFTVQIPLTPCAPALLPVVPNDDCPIVGYQGRRLRILVIDDRPDNRSVLVQMLAPLGFQVLEADNGYTGLVQARSHPPDLIIADVVMPEMDGYSFLQCLHQTPTGQAPKVILTSASPQGQQLALTQGGDGFLVKPIQRDSLLDLMAHHLALTWIRAPKSPNDRAHDLATAPLTEGETVAMPPLATLQHLQQQAAIGDVKALRATLQALVAQDAQYQAFAAPLMALAWQFRIEEIEALLHQYLTEAAGIEESGHGG
ncbi:MAG: ATP-binding protein [Cyanobacteria bacterium]|nr:ATP-binding protein [Cyanobacteriota bacterium]